MALDPKKLQEAKQLLSDIEKEYKKIGSVNPFKNVEAANADINELKEGLKEAKTAADDTASSLSSVANSITDSVNELSKQNKYLNQARSTSNQIAKSAQDALAVRRGETSINEKSVKQAKERLSSQKRILKNSQLNLGVFSEEGMEIKSIIDSLQDYEDGLEGVLKTHEEINKELGFAPKIAANLDKALQKVGVPSLGIADALDQVKKNGQKAATAGGKIGKDFKPAKEFTKQIGSNLKDSFSKANLLQGTIGGIAAGLLSADKQTGELAKGLGMSFSRASSMRKEFASIANNSLDINVNVKDLQESQVAIGQALGTNAQLNKEDLVTMTDLVKKTGLQHSELIGIQKLSLATGKSLDDNVKSALGGATAYASQNKLVVDNNKILREVNNASDSLKLSLGGSVEALGEAVVKAQQFGFDLEKAESIASSMLDFESSIENELSAELLTGKNLNLERARQLALEGDIASAAAEVADQLGNSEEFGKMNVIQQEALAKSVGLTRDQLASSLIEREALAKMSMVEGETAQERYNNLLAEGKTREEIAALLGEEAAGQLEQQSNQDKFNASIEKLKEIFVQVGDVLMPIFSILTNIAEVVVPPIMYVFESIRGILSGSLEDLSGFQIILGGIVATLGTFYTTYKAIQTVQTAINALKSKEIALTLRSSAAAAASLGKSMAGAVANIVKGAWASLGPIPFVGAALAAAATIGGIAYLYSQSSKAEKVKDAAIDPKGGLIVSGPKGTYQGDPQDTVVMGTGIGKGKGAPQQGGGGGAAPKVDMTKTNALLQQLINVIQSGGSVTLDGQKVGEALKLGSFQTQ